MSSHSSHKVRPVQAVGEERCSEGTSSVLGISAMSGLEEKGEGEEAEGSEWGQAARLPISPNYSWLQKGFLQRKGLQQVSQPHIFLNPVLTDDLFLLQAFAVTSGTRS